MLQVEEGEGGGGGGELVCVRKQHKLTERSEVLHKCKLGVSVMILGARFRACPGSNQESVELVGADILKCDIGHSSTSNICVAIIFGCEASLVVRRLLISFIGFHFCSEAARSRAEWFGGVFCVVPADEDLISGYFQHHYVCDKRWFAQSF